MNTIEDRLRSATQAAADSVADFSQRPLRLPARAPGYGLPRTPVAPPRLMASLAAATAIVAVAAIVVVARGVAADNRPVAGQASGAVPAGVPPFFVATVATGNGALKSSEANEAEVVRTATGQVLATVKVPAPYNAFGAVTAAADDRTFVLAAEKFDLASKGWVRLDGPTRLYLLRFNPARAKSITLTALKIPGLPDAGFPVGLALSPSGTRLAVQSQEAGRRHAPSLLQVYDLASGRSRTWWLPDAKSSQFPGISSPSWDGGDRFLATLVYPKAPRRCAAGCVQLLDTTHAGGNIFSASKTIFATASIHRFAVWNSVLLTPEGSRLQLAGLAGRHLKNGESEFATGLLYDITAPSGHILSHRTDRTGNEFVPLWVGTRARLSILGRYLRSGTITATLYGQHRPASLHLPANTLDAAW